MQMNGMWSTRRIAWALVFAIAGFAVLALAACGDSGDSTSGDTPGAGVQTPADNSRETPGATGSREASPGSGSATSDDGSSSGSSDSERVAIGGESNGKSLSVSAGAAVTFVNESQDTQTVMINGNNESGDLEPGDSFTFTFSRSGTYMVTSDNDSEFTVTISVT